MEENKLNADVTKFLDEMNHPLREVIESLREAILSAEPELTEGIKWNGPNYSFKNEDRITLRLKPEKAVQVIFHRGAKVKKQPEDRLLKDPCGILVWKENDRAVATFKSLEELEQNKAAVKEIVTKWIEASTK